MARKTREEQFQVIAETLAKWTADVGLSGAFLSVAADSGRAVANQVRAALLKYSSAKAFQRDWKWARLSVPLQIRLLVEQVLWEKDGDWRNLVTGFGPIKDVEAEPEKPVFSTKLAKSNVIRGRRVKRIKRRWYPW